MSESDDTHRPADAPETVAEAEAELPSWDDEYLQRVADRLKFNYDLQRDYAAGGERFEMYGRLYVESQKQFLHQSINWANYETVEHLFVRRADGVSEADLDALVELGHDLAEEWIEPSEEHQGTDFTFVLVVSDVPENVRSYVDGFRDRTLLKYGYYGAYEVNLAVVAPDREDAVGSTEADVTAAFELWRDLEAGPSGLLGRLRAWLG
ncbi:hypothetical protein NDI85_06430 [Halomicroarcula sp. S1AR25-4]|uniref:hypothetical protein n=1 Tax=Haloarcula sp. S1AR25-4 TaxID=2950538 RepID=UPI002874ABAC|nr:hypothetical protein [Halomicroarcula sp. S1AR25-4]MDS0277423.1 hypothetical protein [Halomicroarcula sp. S1AR25-4]